MKASPECLICILEDVYGAVKTARGEKPREDVRLLTEVMKMLHEEFSLEKPPNYYITKAHRVLKRMTGIEDPYRETKSYCNKVGLEIASKVKAEAQALPAEKRLTRFVRYAIAGNLLDFRTAGISYDFDESRIENWLQQEADGKLTIDDTDKIVEKAMRSRSILYVADNVGEIAFDRILVEELVSCGSYVVVAVKGLPITSDATTQDAEEVGMTKVASKIILSGMDTLGVVFREAEKEFLEEFEKADLIISKGQANYYAISERQERGGIAFLLTTKCECAAESFGVHGKVSIAKYIDSFGKQSEEEALR